MGKSLFDLSGRVAFITGAAGGLGYSMAEVYVAHGAHVVISDLDEGLLREAAERLNSLGVVGKCTAMVCDVADEGALPHLIDEVACSLGRLDIVVANAGISAGPGPFFESGALEDVDLERWRRVLDVNLTAVFETIKAASVHLKRARAGRIIVTASAAGLSGDPIVGYAYAATKAGVINLVRQAAIDLAPFGVNINAIAPGPIRTNIGNGRLHEAGADEIFAAATLLKRIGHPDEIKGAALLLASDASSYMTGTTISVDGGFTAW